MSKGPLSALLQKRRLVENVLWTPLIKQLNKC